jgi:hypothetical protein
MSSFDDAMAQADLIAFSQMGKMITVNGRPISAVVSPSGRSLQRFDDPGFISRVSSLKADVAYSELLQAASGSSFVGLQVLDGSESYVIESYSVNGSTVTLYCGSSTGTGSQF